MSVYTGSVNLSRGAVYTSPWKDATQDEDGVWHLPEYPCEIKGLPDNDPRKKPWKPGDFVMGVDNVEEEDSKDGKGKMKREWGGQKLWEGERPPKGWDSKAYPDRIQRLLQVPHMPGQPLKEMFARQKAIDPRPFEDRYFDAIVRNLPEAWPKMMRQVRWAEQFGIHSEGAAAEWSGQELECLPAVYVTPRPDTVSICVGVADDEEEGETAPPAAEGAEYDYLEFLFARDQDDNVIQIRPFTSNGMMRHRYSTYSFVPPRGTTSITPFACFKIRGIWRGATIEWNPSIPNEDMDWFTNISPEMRLRLARGEKLDGASKLAQKPLPMLPLESSWEANAARAIAAAAPRA